MTRWLAYWLLTVSLGAGVFFKGGVYAQQWEWSALGIAIAAGLSVLPVPKKERSPSDRWGFTILALLLGWMLLQFVPLPPALIERLSPEHWKAVAVAREATGQDSRRWVALSVAPAATLERLLDVIPAMAAFVAAREMAWWLRHRMWIAVAPVIGLAWLESVLGLAQFYFMRMAGGHAGSATGTYVNRNHFAGLLEMTFPLAVMWSLATWRTGNATGLDQPVGTALRTAGLLGISACLLIGVILSLSRMGFISTLIATGLTMLMLLGSLAGGDEGSRRCHHAWKWLIPVALPLCIIVFLPTQELIRRFADMAATEEISKDTRREIWQDTRELISDYRWTGVGLGAYERALYRYKSVAPINTVDFAHNDYLQILAELGTIGATLVAALAAWILWRLLSVVLWRRGSVNWALAVGLLAGMLALSIHSLADFNLYIPANALAFAWLSGIAVNTRLGKC